MPTTYTHTTFAGAVLQLNRLLGCGDDFSFWTEDELKSYIVEALRWWGGAAMYWRETAEIYLNDGQVLYEVPATFFDSGQVTALQSFDVTDRETIQAMIYNLMETPITNWAAPWPGTEMFDFPEITTSVQNARDEVLKMSGIITERRTYDVQVGQNRQDLDEETLHVVRVVFTEDCGCRPKPIWVIDDNQVQSTVSSAIIPANGYPKAYSLNYTPNLAMDLWPAPENDGFLDVYSVESGVQFDPTNQERLLQVPDDFSWVVKYRALEDMFAGDGLARAAQMSEYCHKRVEDALDLMASYQSFIWASINGRRLNMSPTAQMDLQRPDWESTFGTPTTLHMLSWSQYFPYPVPDSDINIIAEVVRKAIIPTADEDFIQVGPEYIQTIYDYAQHIAMIKEQGEEFIATLPMYQSCVETAMEYRSRQAAFGVNYDLQIGQANRDKWARAYRRKSQADAATAMQKGVRDGIQ